MEKATHGKRTLLTGNCGTAISNRVEGALCCTAGMKQMATCIRQGVGDFKKCKHAWNAIFKSHVNAYLAEAVMGAFKPGGYCSGVNVTNLMGLVALGVALIVATVLAIVFIGRFVLTDAG